MNGDDFSDDPESDASSDDPFNSDLEEDTSPPTPSTSAPSEKRTVEQVHRPTTGLRLDESLLALVKNASQNRIKHVSLFTGTPNIHEESTALVPFPYPPTWPDPCLGCRKNFDTVPVFPVHSYDRNKDLWMLYRFGHCGLLCAKAYLIKEHAVPSFERVSLMLEFACKFLGHDGSRIPYRDPVVETGLCHSSIPLDDRRTVTAILRNPPFAFIPTWIEQTDITEFENKKKMNFQLVHNLKATQEQQKNYEKCRKTVRDKNAASKRPNLPPVP